MLLTAEKLTADVALQTGMANRIGTLADAQAWAAEIAGLAPLALQHAKRVLNDDGAYEDQGRSTRSCSTRRGAARTSSRPRWRAWKSGHRISREPDVLRAALRFGFGTATLLGGSWVLRAVHGAPAALGAGPGEIHAVAQGSPNYRDGAFVNIDPASPVSLDREQQRLLIRELVGSRSEDGRADPSGGGVDGSRRRTGEHGGLLVRPLHLAGGGRRVPGAHRPGVESPVFAVAERRPAADARGAGAAGGAAGRGCGADQP